MELKGIEKKYWELVFDFPKYRTAIVKIFQYYYFVNYDGYFLPHYYSDNRFGLSNYHEMNFITTNKDFEIKEIEQIDEEHFKIKCPFKLDDSQPIGIAHASGRRFIYDIENHEINGLKSTLIEYKNAYDVYEIGTNQRHYFFSKVNCSIQFVILNIMNHNCLISKNYEFDSYLNSFDFKCYDLKVFFDAFKKHFNDQEKKINESYDGTVEYALQLIRVRKLLRLNYQIEINSDSLIGLPRGKFLDHFSYNIYSTPLICMINTISDL